MKKILFVCLGNICRSPLAEGILRHFNERNQLGLELDSAGTSSYHTGEAPDPRTIANALTHGVDLRSLRARTFSPSDFEHFDFIYVMDKQNLKHVRALARSEDEANKVQLYLSAVYGRPNLEVPDPYYGSEKDFEAVFQLLQKASKDWCTGFLNIHLTEDGH